MTNKNALLLSLFLLVIAQGARSQDVDCGDLDDPPNGRVTLTTTTLDSTATYECNHGYTLEGDERRKCQERGEWDRAAPTCAPVDCGGLDDPSNGQVTVTRTTLDSVAEYECNYGYMLRGESRRKCQERGEWGGSAPTCHPVDCGGLEDPFNGRVTFSCTLDSVAKYECDEGYSLVGKTMRTCQARGEWGNTAPTCDPVDCGNLPDPANGRVVLSGTTFGSTAFYKCKIGYILDGYRHRYCQADGTWSGDDPTCEAVECRDLRDPRNGRVMLSGTTVGSVATYRCRRGFFLVGRRRRRCQRYGRWSGRPPICVLVDCGPLCNPVNGQVTLTGTKFMSTATYTCSIGLEPIGGSMRSCRANGYWSGTEPVCSAVSCGNLDNPSDGMVTLTGTTFASTATYTCDIGFTLDGDSVRFCLATGDWSGTEPVCS